MSQIYPCESVLDDRITATERIAGKKAASVTRRTLQVFRHAV